MNAIPKLMQQRTCFLLKIIMNTDFNIIQRTFKIYHNEYYLAVRRNERMSFAATWMDLEIIILSEVNQREKDRYHIISLKY